ncbi:MAG: M20 family metallopeptidase [Chloroflexi bacterium]|nr:M20 family metallopeptidase [Chloroflexota bacterium]
MNDLSAAERTEAERLWQLIDAERLAQRALDYMRVPSPTCDELAFAEYLVDDLRRLGLRVDVTRRYPNSPNVIARHDFGPGRTLELDAHLDTIDMPHSPPERRGNRLYGRGACDMKGALACMAETARVLAQTRIPLAGTLLLTAHAMHEAPLGHSEPLDDMIAQGQVGDAVIIGEIGHDHLPVAGLGMAIFDVTIERAGEVLHETKGRGILNPVSVVSRVLSVLTARSSELSHAAGDWGDSLFIGQVHAGDFYNRIPTRCHIQGTRRYGPPADVDDMRAEFARLLAFTEAFREQGITVTTQLTRIADGFSVSPDEEIARCLRQAYAHVHGRELPTERCSVVGNAAWFIRDAGVPCLYHGLDGASAHSDCEYTDLDEMVRLTRTYIMSALCYLRAGV